MFDGESPDHENLFIKTLREEEKGKKGNKDIEEAVNAIAESIKKVTESCE